MGDAPLLFRKLYHSSRGLGFAAVIILVGGVPLACGAAQANSGAISSETQQESLTVRPPAGNTLTFHVEVVSTPTERSVGLMNRTYLAPDAGMLFDFGTVQRVRMWMKNTLIPLDMLFIDRSGTVTHVEADVQPHDLTPRGPEEPVFSVLEIPAGTARKYGIIKGSVVHHPLFGPSVSQGH